MEESNTIKKSKVVIIVAATALFCIVTTGYVSNYIYQQKLAQHIFTFNITDAQLNVRTARKLRNGGREKIIKYLDSTTGSSAIIFTNFNKYAPKNLHQDILETLVMIKNYRDEFKIQSTMVGQQNDIDKSLAQIK